MVVGHEMLYGIPQQQCYQSLLPTLTKGGDSLYELRIVCRITGGDTHHLALDPAQLGRIVERYIVLFKQILDQLSCCGTVYLNKEKGCIARHHLDTIYLAKLGL